MPNNPQGFPYPLPTDPVAQGAAAIKALADAIRGPQIIVERDLAASGGVLDIPAALRVFDMYELVVRARSTENVPVTNLYCRMNGVATAIYGTRMIRALAAIDSYAEVGQTQWYLSPIGGAQAAGGHYVFGRWRISGTGEGNTSNVLGSSGGIVGPGAGAADWGTWQMMGTSAILGIPNQFVVFPTGQLAFGAGSRAWLYGLMGA